MKLFLDTADVAEILKLVPTGLVDGVTTNPSLIAKSGLDIKDVIREICTIVPDGPVSAEVTALDHDTMMKEADVLRNLASNVVIKVPLTKDGLLTCKRLSKEGTLVNVTLCFSAAQALLAAKAGASFISPFIGRLDDINQDGMGLVADIHQIYSNYPEIKTEILAASVRDQNHIEEAALVGADIATLTPALLNNLYEHPLTQTGLDTFMKDWKATGQSIL